jgi:hypothetical protein
LAQLFPRWTNKTPLYTLIGLTASVVLIILLIWYYGSPKNTDVGYRPDQPVDYSHKLHAGDLGIDCRYCHWGVDQAAHANVPATKTCMNCHTLVGTDNEKLLPVRESWATKEPIHWVRVHKVPDYAYFDHSAHVNAGVGCISCHGNVAEMVKVIQVKPLSMSWCLDCHRNPDEHLRPVSEVTNMNWVKPSDHKQFVENWKKEKNINPPVDCSGCHR